MTQKGIDEAIQLLAIMRDDWTRLASTTDADRLFNLVMTRVPRMFQSFQVNFIISGVSLDDRKLIKSAVDEIMCVAKRFGSPGSDNETLVRVVETHAPHVISTLYKIELAVLLSLTR